MDKSDNYTWLDMGKEKRLLESVGEEQEARLYKKGGTRSAKDLDSVTQSWAELIKSIQGYLTQSDLWFTKMFLL